MSITCEIAYTNFLLCVRFIFHIYSSKFLHNAPFIMMVLPREIVSNENSIVAIRLNGRKLLCHKHSDHMRARSMNHKQWDKNKENPTKTNF